MNTDDLAAAQQAAVGERLPDRQSNESGDHDLADRHALRRVASLSTELEDVTEVEYRQVRLERVVLAGVWTSGTVRDADRSLAELALLAETAGSLVLDGVIQRRDSPDPATYLGSGKAQELRDIVVATGADTVICDGELTPGQLRKLEEILKVKVVDRTWLILDIFAQHARSREGKAQVSLAQMQYLLPRLRGWGESLSRQAGGRAGGQTGGVGTRGPGETKIETDRRRIRTQMSKLRKELKEMEKSRTTQRAARHRAGTPAVAIAGYTNAGKSSLLNRLTGAGVLVENALFATLDPTVRKTKTPSGREFTLADTVGFVRHLPHQLIEAFRSTLEEVKDADLILHIVDGSDDAPEEQMAAVREVLNEIDAGGVPELVVINKCDIADPDRIATLLRREPHAVVVSATTGEGIEELLLAIEADLPHLMEEIDVLLPYSRGDLLSRVHSQGDVISIEHEPGGTRLRARVPRSLAGELAQALGD
jgi:GTP-binding protein HflX